MTETSVPSRRSGPHAPLPPAANVASQDPSVATANESLARAARRTAELQEHGSIGDDGADKFYIDPRMVPEGWSYEYRMFTVLGKEDPSYQVRLRNSGWDPVPVSRHPELMPLGYTGNTIILDGMMLMERPLVITEEQKQRDRKNASDQVRAKEQQLTGAAPPGEFERSNKGDRLTSIKKSREATIPIPDK
jgi:hypothetical protein